MSVKRLTWCGIMIMSFCLLLAATGCGGGGTQVGSGPEVTGSKTLETRELDYSDFSMVRAGYNFKVEISEGSTFSVSVTLNEDLFQYLDFKVKDDTLYIGLKTGHTYKNINHSVKVTMPKLSGLTLYGGATGSISGFNSTNALKIETTGASTLDIDGVKTGDTEFSVMTKSEITGDIEMANGVFRVSGISEVRLTGSGGDIEITAKDASTLDFENFAVGNVTADVNTGGEVTVNMSGRLDATVAGKSNLYYTGNPTLGDLSQTGGSYVTPLEDKVN